MANNGLTSPDALVEALAPDKSTAVYAKWVDVAFPHVYLDPTILNRQAAIEAFYLGYLEAVRVLKGKKYDALFKWMEKASVEPGYADFTLTIFTSPPPSKDGTIAFKAAATTMDDPGGNGDDIDPPIPPMPPPPPM